MKRKISQDALAAAKRQMSSGFEVDNFSVRKDLKPGAEAHLRLWMPLENVPGELPFMDVTIWWINNKPYVDPKLILGYSPFERAKEAAKKRARNDQELADVERMLDSRSFNSQEEVWWVGMVLKPYFDEQFADHYAGLWYDIDGKPVYQNNADNIRAELVRAKETVSKRYGIKGNVGTYEPINFDKLRKIVMDDRMKTISLTSSLSRDVIEFLQSSTSSKLGSDMGILDPTFGKNLAVYKTGKGKETRYRIEKSQFMMEFPENIETAWGYKIPDIFEIYKKRCKSAEICENAVMNYVWGDRLIEEKSEDAGARRQSAGAGVQEGPQRRTLPREEQDFENEGRSIADDVESGDDLENLNIG